jgi:putative transposase
MDEVFIRTRGKQHYLWRAVGPERNCPRHPGPSRRSATAAKRFFRKLLKDLQYVTSSKATRRRAQNPAESRAPPKPISQQSREVSHQPTRRPERQMKRFKSARHAHCFLSTHSRIRNHFQLVGGWFQE